MTETAVGVIFFVVIAAAAVGLNFVINELSELGISSGILYGLTGAEYALFVMDLVLFGRFLWKTAIRSWGAF